MKKVLLPVLAVIMVLSIATPVLANGGSHTLWAGKNTAAGTVSYTVIGDNLSVVFETTDGWEMTETHLYVGIDKPTKSAPGKFPYKHEDLGGVTTDPYLIPLSDLGVGPGDTLNIAAHAALWHPIYGEETGWTAGCFIRPGKNWATYFFYTTPSGG